MTSSYITENISYKRIIAIAVPIMFGVLVQNAVLIVDSLFLSKLGETTFNAGGNGGLFYFTIFMLGMGYSNGLQILIAKKIGEGKSVDVGTIFFQGLYFLLALGLTIYLFIHFFADGIIGYSLQSQEIASGTYRFLSIRALGFIFSFTYLVFMAFYLGTARTKIIFITSTTIALLNLILDYVLIFGKFNMPKLGLEGAAIASVISEAIGLLVIFLSFVITTNRLQYGFNGIKRFSKSLSLKILNLSFPLMIQGFLSLAAWSFFFIIVERVGSFELSLSHILRNMYSYAFIPLFGFNAANRTIISTIIGQGKIQLLWIPLKKIIVLNIVFTLLFIHGNLLYPQKIIGLFTSNIEKIAVGSKLLYLITGALLIFSVASAIFNSIAAAEKTRSSLLIEFFAIVLCLACAYLASISESKSIFLIWSAEYMYFSVIGILSLIFLRKIISQKEILTK